MSVARRTVLGTGLAAVPVLTSSAAWAGGRDGGGDDLVVTEPGGYISFSGGAFSLVGAPVVVSPEDHPRSRTGRG
ncbi:hypothetical protein LT493_35375 [Streptomyces tricolor]|nr:hypothetical protein [Streptomyces tricolor]